MRFVARCVSLIVIAATLTGGPAYAGGAGPRAIREQLETEFRLSRIDVQDSRTAGSIARPGTVLTLPAEGIAAKQLRVIQLNTKSPRVHVRDYAHVEVTGDGRARLFTHTVEPVRFEGRQPVFGCTEFVFRFDPAVLERGALGIVLGQIDKWLTRVPGRAAAISPGLDRG